MGSSAAMAVALNTDFQKRVDYYLTKWSIAILAEGYGVENHYNREILAKKVLGGGVGVGVVSVAVMGNAVLAGGADVGAPDQGVSDGDLEFVVNGVMGAMAL